jgi:hypothetical protein
VFIHWTQQGTQWTDSKSHRKSTLLQRRNSRMRPYQNGILVSHFFVQHGAGNAMDRLKIALQVNASATTQFQDATVSERHPDFTLLYSFIGCSGKSDDLPLKRIASQAPATTNFLGVSAMETASWMQTSSFNMEREKR